MASDTRYDALFIDHMMPGMDGIETLKAIRAGSMNPDTTAIALTANAVSGARQMYLDAGFNNYLPKPVDGGKLEKMLRDILPEEKILSADADSGKNEGDSVPEWLKGIEEIDAPSKASEIEELLGTGDIKDYTIKVHALKSSARIIGANDLSELARKLEDAGNSDDLAFIGDNTDRLIGMYRALDDKLSLMDKTDEQDKELIPMDKASMKEAYQTIVEIAQSLDYELMDDLLKTLKDYRLSDEDGNIISGIELKLSVLDWDGIAEDAAKGLTEMQEG